MRNFLKITLLMAVILSIGLPTMAKMTIVDEVGDKKMKLRIFGFSQFDMRAGDGMSDEGGLFFKAQRIRIGFAYFHGPIVGKLFLDFNQSHTNEAGGVSKMIKDAFVAYKFNNSAFIRLGVIKTPLGMNFTIPGWNLDNVERNALDKGLVLERDFGLMLSGRLIGQESYGEDKQLSCNGAEMGTEKQGYGFGYDIGIFNPAGRSAAVDWADWETKGDALAYVGRLHYDYGKPFHVEASYGVSQLAGGYFQDEDDNGEPVGDPFDSEDYKVFDIGVASEFGKWELKGEYINGTNIKGADDRNQDCLTLSAGFMVTKNVQAVIKHHAANSDHPTSGDTSLGNTYMGVNIYLSPIKYKPRDLQRHKLVLNYIMSSGDELEWNGMGGYKDDGFVLQWQYAF